MEFPDDDPYWASTAEFVQTHRHSGERVVAPPEFGERVPGVVPATSWLGEPPSAFGWVVVNKGRLDQFDLRFLVATAQALPAVYANPVFVAFAATPELTAVSDLDVHVDAFRVNLQAALAACHTSVQAGFELQPYVQAVPDPHLRLDPRTALNQICDISDWRDGPMLSQLEELREPVRIHRKAWEMGKCLAGLERLGAIRPDAAALSVGAGAERTLFHLANRVGRVVATDLYLEQDGLWGWGADFMKDPARYAPFPYRQDRLEVLHMSGLDLELPDASFDIVYTLSSIEHFGGHEAAAQSMREMARVTRPGGVVCVVTELLLSRRVAPDFFTWPEVERHLVRTDGLELVEPDVDLRISESLLAHPVHLSRDPASVSPHIVITGHGDTGAVWTSIILFFRKQPTV
jgi:SAM-dependent methyltransferase